MYCWYRKRTTENRKNENYLGAFSKVTVPLKEAITNIECKFKDFREYGDHTLFVGEMVGYSYKKSAFLGGKPAENAKFLSHLSWKTFIDFHGNVKEV